MRDEGCRVDLDLHTLLPVLGCLTLCQVSSMDKLKYPKQVVGLGFHSLSLLSNHDIIGIQGP